MPHFTLDEIAKMSDDGYRQDYYDSIKDTAEKTLGTYKDQIRKKENKQIDKKLANSMAHKIAGAYANILKKQKFLDFKGEFDDESSFKKLSLEERARIHDTLRSHFGFDIENLKESLEGKKISDHLNFLNEYAEQLVDFAKKAHHQKNAGYLSEHLKTDRKKTIAGVNKHLGEGYNVHPESKDTIREDKLYELLKLGKEKNLTPKLVKDQLKYMVKYTGK